MELRIETGALTVPIVRDGAEVGTIRVNPHDVGFVDAFYGAIGRYQARAEEYAAARTALAPGDMAGLLALIRRVTEALRADVDALFGPGTAALLTGPNALGTPDVFAQFFEGLAGLIEPVRRAQVGAYLPEEDGVDGGAQDA